jgi:hypothetical protein
MESTVMTPQERAEAVFERLLTPEVSDALQVMSDAARVLGAALAETYVELERKSERKSARRQIHNMLSGVLAQTWGEIVPSEEPA